MTSTNDGKNVKSNQSCASKGKAYYIDIYKSLDAHLSVDCELHECTKHLCLAWRRIYSLCQYSTPSTQDHLINWLPKHTTRIILQTEWQSPNSKDEHALLKDAIDDFIKESQAAAQGRNGVFLPWEKHLSNQGEWFKNNLANPWGHPVLRTLLDPQGKSLTNEEVLEWLKEERGLVFVTRLKQLTLSRCHDLALALVSAVMDRVRAENKQQPDADIGLNEQSKEKTNPLTRKYPFVEKLKDEAGFTKDVWEFLIDIEFVLLHKGEGRSRCIDLAKQTPLHKGYPLVQRLQNHFENFRKKKEKIWKNAKEVAILIAQVVIARCMVVARCAGLCRNVLYKCGAALARLLPPERLPAAANALAAPAVTATHLHTLAAAVDSESAGEMKPFVCELYVRAITAGMNELERLKLKSEKESEARSMEQTLSSWFIHLGSLLRASERFNCECILTAFSVHPSQDMYDMIKAAPILPPVIVDSQDTTEGTRSEFGSWASDSRSQTNLVKTSETLNMKQTQHQANVLSTALLNEGEALGLGPELCQDIAVLLSGPRVKTLSWDMERECLLEHCKTYMERTHRGTRALTTELKYLNLDPSHFQHLPEEDDDENDIYYGIEKGYEHLVEFQEPEEIWENDILSNEITDTDVSFSGDSGSPVIWRKKKNKTLINLEEEPDPLSTITEANNEKKEQTHAKERTKEHRKKKTVLDPLSLDELEEKGGKRNKEKKERKVRKKKEKDKLNTSPSYNCVKNFKNNNLLHSASITDSDYDSQGKISLYSNSEANEDIVYDGLYCMDEMNIPKKIDDHLKLPLSNEFLQEKPELSLKSYPVSHDQINIQNKMVFPQTSSMPGPDSSSVSLHQSVSEKVKNSLSQLIERRNNCHISKMSSKANNIECKMPMAIPRSNVEIPTNIKPKVITIPEMDIPQSYIDKNVESANAGIPLNQTIIKPVPKYHYKNIVSPRLINTTGPSKIPIKDKDIFIHKPKSALPYTTPCQSNFQTFLRELKESINAGAGTQPPGPHKKHIQSTGKVAPFIPNLHKSEPKTVNSAKLVQQKKDLNTFSRLSYMYKNKIDNKQIHQTAIDFKSPVLSFNSVTEPKIDRLVEPSKVKYSSMNMNSIISRPDKKTTYDNFVNRDQQVSKNIYDNAIGMDTINSKVLVDKMKMKSHRQAPMATTMTSALSEKDQNDLLLLLEQKSKLNAPLKQTIREPSVLRNKRHLESNNMLKTPSFIVQNSLETDVPVNLVRPKNKNVTEVIPSCSKVVSEKIEKTEVTEPTKSRLSPEHIQKPPTDWEEVMDAIRAHRTPSRGPNALELALNKSSKTCENLRNQRIVKSSSSCVRSSSLKKANETVSVVNQTSVISRTQDVTKTTTHIPETVKVKELDPNELMRNNVPQKSQASNISNHKIKTTITHCNTEAHKMRNLRLTKKSNQIENKKLPVEIQKKQFTYTLPRQDDPFISGLPNSDYYLLDDLIDDELRQEIAELSDDDFNISSNISRDVKNNKQNEHICKSTSNTTHLCKSGVTSSTDTGARNVFQSEGQNNKKSSLQKPVNPIQISQQHQSNTINIVQPILNKICKNEDPKPQMPSVIQSFAGNVAYPKNIGKTDYSLVKEIKANILTTPEPNIYVIPPVTLSNVILVGSDVYNTYSNLQSEIPAPNILPNLYINQSNIPLHQPAQYSAPVVNSLIIGNTVTVSTSSFNQVPVMPIKNLNLEKSADDIGSHVQNYNINTPISEVATGKCENVSFDFNPNKSERKVLSQVQEKQEISEINELILETQNQKVLFENILKDKEKDKERLLKKRMSIINRKVYHGHNNQPIPLTYAPLDPFITYKIEDKISSASVKKDMNIKENTEQELALNINRERIGKLMVQEVNDALSIDGNENCKENNSLPQSRRIFLRSSNKPKGCSSIIAIPKEGTGISTKIKLKNNLIENNQREGNTGEKLDDKKVVKKKKVIVKRLSKSLRKMKDISIARKKISKFNDHSTLLDCNKKLPDGLILKKSELETKNVTDVNNYIQEDRNLTGAPLSNFTSVEKPDIQECFETCNTEKITNILSEIDSKKIDKIVIRKVNANEHQIACKNDSNDVALLNKDKVLIKKDIKETIQGKSSEENTKTVELEHAISKIMHLLKTPTKESGSCEKITKELKICEDTSTSIIYNKAQNIMGPKEKTKVNDDEQAIKEAKEVCSMEPKERIQTIDSSKTKVSLKIGIAKSNSKKVHTVKNKKSTKPKINELNLNKSKYCENTNNSDKSKGQVKLQNKDKTKLNVTVYNCVQNKDQKKDSVKKIDMDQDHTIKSKKIVNVIVPEEMYKSDNFLKNDNLEQLLESQASEINELCLKKTHSTKKKKTAKIKITDPKHSKSGTNFDHCIGPTKSEIKNLVKLKETAFTSFQNEDPVNNKTDNANETDVGQITPIKSKQTSDIIVPEKLNEVFDFIKPRSSNNVDVIGSKKFNRIKHKIRPKLAIKGAANESIPLVRTSINCKKSKSIGKINKASIKDTICIKNAVCKPKSFAKLNVTGSNKNNSQLNKTVKIDDVSKSTIYNLITSEQVQDSVKTKDVFVDTIQPREQSKFDAAGSKESNLTKIDTIKPKESSNLNNVFVDNIIQNPKNNSHKHTENIKSTLENTTKSTVRNIKSSVDKITPSNNMPLIPDSLKNKIVIERLPNPLDAPHKQCVRVKLPNKRTFKATIQGSHVNVDTLFADPNFTSILLNNLTNRHEYSLNVKQISTINKDNPQKVETRIQEVNFATGHKSNVIETVSLLSDEENEVHIQSFLTEFGKYRIKTIDKDIHIKHQNKLNKKCHVKLKRLEQRQKNVKESKEVIPPTRERSFDTKQFIDMNTLCDFKNKLICDEVITYNIHCNTQSQKLSQIIEIDDSSNDSENIIPTLNENVDNLKDLLIKDVLSETIEDSNLKDFIKSKSITETVSKCRDCFVKVINCDDLVEKYDQMKSMNMKSTIASVGYDVNNYEQLNTNTFDVSSGNIDTNKCDSNVYDRDDTSLLSRSDSFSILNDFSLYDINEASSIESDINMDIGSPVMEVYGIIANLCDNIHRNETETVFCYDYIICNSELFETKRYLHKFYKSAITDYVVEVKKMSNVDENDKLCMEQDIIFNVPRLTTLMVTFFQTNNIVSYLKHCSVSPPPVKQLKRKWILNDHKVAYKVARNELKSNNNFTYKTTYLENLSRIDAFNAKSITSFKSLNIENNEILNKAVLDVDVGSNTDEDYLRQRECNKSPEVRDGFDEVYCEKDIFRIVDENKSPEDFNDISNKEEILNTACVYTDSDKLDHHAKFLGERVIKANHDFTDLMFAKCNFINNDPVQRKVQTTKGNATTVFNSETVKLTDYKFHVTENVNTELQNKFNKNFMNNKIISHEIINETCGITESCKSSKTSRWDEICENNEICEKKQFYENYEICENNEIADSKMCISSDINNQNDKMLIENTQTMNAYEPHIKTGIIVSSHQVDVSTRNNKTSKEADFNDEDIVIEHDIISQSVKNLESVHSVGNCEKEYSSDIITPLADNKILTEQLESEFETNRYLFTSSENLYSTNKISLTNCSDDSNVYSPQNSDDACKEGWVIQSSPCILDHAYESCYVEGTYNKDKKHKILAQNINEYFGDNPSAIEGVHGIVICEDDILNSNFIETVVTMNSEDIIEDYNYCDTKDMPLITSVEDINKTINEPYQIDKLAEKELLDRGLNIPTATKSAENCDGCSKTTFFMDRDINDVTELNFNKSQSIPNLLWKSENPENINKDVYEITTLNKRSPHEDEISRNKAGSEIVNNYESNATVSEYVFNREKKILSTINEVSDNQQQDLLDEVKFKDVSHFQEQNNSLIDNHISKPSALDDDADYDSVKKKDEYIIINPKENNTLIKDSTLKRSQIFDEFSVDVSNDCIQKQDCELKGIEYIDPELGTYYVFEVVESVSQNQDCNSNMDCEIIPDDIVEVNEDVKLKTFATEHEKVNELKFDVNKPVTTYSRTESKKEIRVGINVDKRCRSAFKRKLIYNDKKVVKKYRKGKNIDYPKFTANAISNITYGKEYKCLLDYCSSIKFSYLRAFHKEYIDVDGMLNNWPIKRPLSNIIANTEPDKTLFMDIEDINSPKNIVDPTTITLAEEINSDYSEITQSLDETKENNFNMGFGEGSGRVNSDLEGESNVSKFSAATLSDVKQIQPYLLSQYCEKNTNTSFESIELLNKYVNFINLKEKVRSFFKQNTLDLNSTWMKENKKLNYPFDLNSSEFFEPTPIESIVNVVQVGQLPVSATAQNPVTCDPRVTQVSNASPSQCSTENISNDDPHSAIKTEYTELTTADLSLPLQNYSQENIKTEYTELTTANLPFRSCAPQDRSLELESSEASLPVNNDSTQIETEIKTIVKIELMEELPEDKEEPNDVLENNESLKENKDVNIDYTIDSSNNINASSNESSCHTIAKTSEEQNESEITQKPHNGPSEKIDQIAHAMNAAGISTTIETSDDSVEHPLVNIISQNMHQGAVNLGNSQTVSNNYPKASITALALQQALAQILPPPLNQTNTESNQQHASNPSVTSQVLHIVQGANAAGNQITLVDNSEQSVLNTSSSTPVLHILPSKGPTVDSTSSSTSSTQSNPFSGISLVDTTLQSGNQLLHIVNAGNQKNNSAGQLLKRVNLLTNLTNVQGSNDQKMLQFVCKSADGKAIQLNAQHQRSMVLRLQPIETTNIQNNGPKSIETLESGTNPTGGTTLSKESISSQQEFKSRSVYEENYAKFIQNSSPKASVVEKATSLPKFNQAFGKQVFQDGSQKNENNNDNSHISAGTTNSENMECQQSENAINLEHIAHHISSPPLLLRTKTSGPASQMQSNLTQQVKPNMAPMNVQTMHGGVIYTRQIPVNIGGGQTINLITVPSTELMDDNNQKQQSDIKFLHQGDIEPSIIKIVPHNQPPPNAEVTQDDSSPHLVVSSENTHTPQPQPVLTQMRIKLPMLSKAPQMVSGARVVRPSFFQIQRNVIGGVNQPVYQQLVLTAAPQLGPQTIRLPQTQARTQVKVPSDTQSSAESQMSSSTLEQLREFDLVLEQVKERSTVQPNSCSNTTFSKLRTLSADATDGSASVSSTSMESTQQVLYSIGNNQPMNVAYLNRKTTITTPTTSTLVRSPDSSGIVDSPTSSSQIQLPHTVTESTTHETPVQSKPSKSSSKSKSRPKSSHPPNALKLNTVTTKASTQKPLEDEQTTQRILYILAEYKEQVENSPDKDKPAPRRRSNPPSNPSGSSKRKKSSSSSRRHGARDLSPVHGDDTCRTMGSEDSSCGTSQGDCNESCLDSHSPQDSPRKVVRKLSFDHDTPVAQSRSQAQRNVIVADGQTITVARGTAGKPTTAVLMPANYILPVSMVKGGQQIAIVTNRGPKLLTVGGGEGGPTSALLLQRLIGPTGLKPMLARPGVRHVRLPATAIHSLQTFNLTTATTIQPPDSTASPVPAPTPPELVETQAVSSPWAEREAHDVKPERTSSPEGSEPWHLHSADPRDYSYEESVRTEGVDRTVLDPIPDRYSPDMEAQRIFDKMFDVDAKKSYNVDSPRCGYDIDTSDCEDKGYHQVVHRRDGPSYRQQRLTHVSAAALRHKYAILEHELRLQKSLSEECEDLGVDSPSASELFPEAELLFASSPSHDHTQDQAHHSHTPQPSLYSQSNIPQPDIDDQIATDQLLSRGNDLHHHHDISLGLEDVGIVTVSEDGMQATIALDQEEFARSHPNTTFHSEPTDDGEIHPFTISGIKGRHITSTIFHSNRIPGTVLVTAPQTTVISQATGESSGAQHTVKYTDIDNMINSLPSAQEGAINISSVLVRDDGMTRFDNLLNDSREIQLSNTASAIVHSAGNATQVIRRVCCYGNDRRDTRYIIGEPDTLMEGDNAKMIGEDNSRDATLEPMADAVDDDRSTPERHAELFWETNSTSERSESRRNLDFSSDSDKCCNSPTCYETNSTDSSGVGTHMRLDSVIKEARGVERSFSADGSSTEDIHPPLRTYPAKRTYHSIEGDVSMSGKTRAGERSPEEILEVRRRASGRGVVKRGCHCCNGSPVPPRPKKSRLKKPCVDFSPNH